jgi:hypothetical protein
MAMFTLYCDDSGTHPKSDVAVAGCYVATIDQWTHFKRNWEELNERENFGVFHMADFVAKQAQFAAPDWQDQKKRDRTVKALISTIKTRSKIGFSAVVLKSAYDELIVGDPMLRERFGDNHYAFAIRLCTALVDKWRQKYGYKEPVEYVFDRVSQGKGDINAMFETLVSGKQDALHRYGVYEDCWSFQDKAKVIQLQAADIWAYENYRYMIDVFMPFKVQGIKGKRPRQSYVALVASPVEVRYHVRHTLEELIRRVDGNKPKI